MENHFEEFESQPILTNRDIFTKIWKSPREVFKYVNDNKYDKHITVLLVLAGISSAFDRAALNNMGDHSSLGAIVGLSVIIGGLLGWISYYIYAALISWSGEWLNGQGNRDSILRILSYAMLPSILSTVFIIPQIAIYGIEFFKSDGDTTSAGIIPNLIFYGSSLFEVGLGIWTIVLCVIGVSEVQKLSIGKAILNLLLPVIFIVVPIVLLVLLFSAF